MPRPRDRRRRRPRARVASTARRWGAAAGSHRRDMPALRGLRDGARELTAAAQNASRAGPDAELPRSSPRPRRRPRRVRRAGALRPVARRTARRAAGVAADPVHRPRPPAFRGALFGFVGASAAQRRARRAAARATAPPAAAPRPRPRGARGDAAGQGRPAARCTANLSVLSRRRSPKPRGTGRCGCDAVVRCRPARFEGAAGMGHPEEQEMPSQFQTAPGHEAA